MDEAMGAEKFHAFEDLSNAEILVTGGTGFIGRHLIGRLLSLGAQVTIVDRTTRVNLFEPSRHLTTYTLSLPDSSIVDLIKQDRFTAVFHLAGPSSVPSSIQNPADDLFFNAHATLQILEAIRHHSLETRLIYMASAAVYGNPDHLPVAETTPLHPISPYGISKLATEMYISLYARLHDLQTASLRPFSIYGPGQKKLVVYDLIQKLQTNPDRIEVYGTGEEVRDFLYVDDMVAAAIMVMIRGDLKGEAYNVASGHGTVIRDIVGILTSTIKLSPQICYTGKGRPGDPAKWIADISKLAGLGFRPTVNLKDGLKQVVRWYDSL
ncbi:MAG: NAD-dependent epimerase/dehydratase family protein [Candidatus Latescibacteria bacterium]|nr:NAD-dependent epimerase/dehydratase family protein [Candidatus Latescibacterota bacterium]